MCLEIRPKERESTGGQGSFWPGQVSLCQPFGLRATMSFTEVAKESEKLEVMMDTFELE